MICSRCIMDTTVPGIFFDDKGECNFCKIHDEMDKLYPMDGSNETKLKKIADTIRLDGKGREYDCVVGVSGGMDSTYVLYIVKKMGLHPLAVHMDNGWDSELAVRNIRRVLKKLEIELHTVVLDWEEFKDIQKAFLKASVPDVETPTDSAIKATLYNVAKKNGIKYIINGQSFRTGGKCPIGWHYEDGKYIRSIYKTFGESEMKNFPYLTMWERINYMYIKKIKRVPILNYVDYDVKKVTELLSQEVGWRDYGVKHYESVYTRFIQSYILPKKFNIDKRKIHLSALIRDGQITRDKAIEEINKPPYEEKRMEDDKEYVIKKLGLTHEEFEEIMAKPPKTFLEYPNSFKLQRFLIKLGYKTGKLPKKHRYYTYDSLTDSKNTRWNLL